MRFELNGGGAEGLVENPSTKTRKVRMVSCRPWEWDPRRFWYCFAHAGAGWVGIPSRFVTIRTLCPRAFLNITGNAVYLRQSISLEEVEKETGVW